MIREIAGKDVGWLPENVFEYLKRNISNVQINVNSTDALNGYGIKLGVEVVVSRYYEKCNKHGCEFHSLFNPVFEHKNYDHRHKYTRGYADVFRWVPESGKTLEEAFGLFLEAQPDRRTEPLVYVSFSKPGKPEMEVKK